MSREEPSPSAYPQVTQTNRAESSYPALLIEPWESSATPLFRASRDATGLITVALRHGDLSQAQRDELGRFRLAQFVLWGWYDPEADMVRAARSDPAFDALSSETIHVLTGMLDGRVLAYMCVEPASWPRGASIPTDTPATAFSLGQSNRPLFPTEVELSGPEVFASLPQLRVLTTEQVREPSCLLRNKLVQTPLSIAAAMDVFCTTAALLMEPAMGLRALVGHGDSELRAMMASLGIPALYAPFAPNAPVRRESYWAKDMDAPGKFWPFVIPVEDLRAHAEHLRSLAAVLSYPIREMRRALVRMRKNPQVTPPRSLLPLPLSSPVYWTSDATFSPGRDAALAAAPEHYHERR